MPHSPRDPEAELAWLVDVSGLYFQYVFENASANPLGVQLKDYAAIETT